MNFDRSPKTPQNFLSWIEWIVTIGVVGLGLSLIIYAYYYLDA